MLQEKVQLTMDNAFWNTGQLEKAVGFYKKKRLKIALEVGDKPLEVTGYGDLGAVYRTLVINLILLKVPFKISSLQIFGWCITKTVPRAVEFDIYSSVVVNACTYVR